MQLDPAVHRITIAQWVLTCRLRKHQLVTNVRCGREHKGKYKHSHERKIQANSSNKVAQNDAVMKSEDQQLQVSFLVEDLDRLVLITRQY